ncbi:hypothetical protein GCM10023093_24260 [Nemorincola caseinilytica]|uniref:Uncharacterized protein n=1 Tax=Nemorincola caseinilytica TaxID=2054315 RepID=A0ABP8NM27_9BACT
MELRPFTLEEAEEICEDFEDLKDTEFALEGRPYMVEDVVVCPFETTEKEAFFAAYENGERNVISSADTDAPLYDVILIVSDLDANDGLSFMSVRQYVAGKGVIYNFPVE